MDPIVVGAFPKNRTKMVAGEISEFEGTVRAHIRVYTLSVDGGLVPTRQGVSMPLECVSAVRDAVHRLEEVAGPGRLVGEIDVGRQRIRVGTTLFEEQMYLDVRRFYEQGGKWLPTPKGVMVRPELLPHLVALADELAVEAARVV